MATSRMVLALAVLIALAAAISGCGGASDDASMATGAISTPTTTPTVTALTGNTIMLTGGGGPNVATGGIGGVWNIETYSVKGVSMKLSGIAPAAFTVPAYNPVPDFGPNPATVSTNTTVQLLASGAVEPGAGVLYQVATVAGDNHLYIGDGTGSIVPDSSAIVTGLKVNAGVTLTLSLNRDNSNSDGDANNTTGQDLAWAVFSNDVEILGAVKVKDLTTASGTDDTRHGAPATNRDMGGLEIDAAQAFVRAGGSLNTAGLPGAASSNQRGGDSGMTVLAANNFVINEGTLDASGGKGDGTGIGGNGNTAELAAVVSTGGGVGGGVVVNKGKLLAGGGEGATGGTAAEAVLEANSHVFNTGPVSASGGKGTAGSGGNGIGAYLFSSYGSVFNSGAVTVKGGDGTTGGGAGGLMLLTTGYGGGYEGDAANTGVLNVSGGNATSTGNGGNSGTIYLGGYLAYRVFGSIRNSGSLIANGGDSQGAGNGGNAGAITIWNEAGADFSQEKYAPIKPIQLSGNIGLRGGTSYSGGNGGNGGALTIKQGQSPAGDLSQGGIQLTGYARADLSGGSGTAAGSDATFNAMNVYTYADKGAVTDALGYAYLPVGPIYNELAISAMGGSATNAASVGGTAGYLTWETRSTPGGTPADSWAGNGASAITNKGKIDLSGGSGGTGGGGDSGGLKWYGHDGVTNTGAILNKGGNSAGGTGGTGGFNEVFLVSSMDVVNSGAVTTTGGSGLSGGAGSESGVEMFAGGQVRNSGSILSNGGAATSGTGGNGGLVDLMSESKPTQNTAALISVAKGLATAGGTAGSIGEIWIDWVDVTPADGTRP